MRRSIRSLLIAAVVAAGMPGTAGAASPWTVRSPNGALAATVAQDVRGGPLRLDIERGGEPVLTSDLGLVTSGADLSNGLSFIGRTDRRVDERFEMPAGKSRRHRLLAREMALEFRTAGSAELRIEVRAADDGIAYRYVVPGTATVDVTGERSAFRARARTRAWMLPWRPNYENHYEAVSLRDAPPRIYGFPALLSVGDRTWALVSEANVDGNYAASQLTVSGSRPGTLQVTLPQPSVHSSLPLATPWRVAVIGDIDTAVESDLVTDLGAASRVADTDWIRPGTVAWSWWSDGGSPRDFERQKQYVDYAAEVGWRYVLVDEGWSPDWMPELVRYAARRGVGIIAWARWDDLETQAERDALLPLSRGASRG